MPCGLASSDCVRALLDQPAMVEHDDVVGIDHRREAMRDDDGRAALHHLGEGLLHPRLGLIVERRRGFVEHQDRRIAHDGARDGQPLALAAGERDAVLADQRVVALGLLRE